MSEIHSLIPLGPVLLVDDDEEYLAQTKAELQTREFNVVAMESANHAIKFIERQPWAWYPWIVVTDLVMTGMSGYEFIRRLKERFSTRDFPIIVVTKLRSPDDQQDAELAGASLYLRKPVTVDELLEAMKKATAPKKPGVDITYLG